MSERIDFIGEYCDRWCERCAFTDRCSAFAVRAAIAMCDGDVEAAIALAVGQPQPDDNGPKRVPPRQRWMDEALPHITEDDVDQARLDEGEVSERHDVSPPWFRRVAARRAFSRCHDVSISGAPVRRVDDGPGRRVQGHH